MQSVKAKRTELLEKLKHNRTGHRALFLKALEGYRKAVVEELQRMIDDAQSGRPIRRQLSLPEPKDYTDEYDCVITMLEMSVDDVIELSVHHFQMYVMDKWEWSNIVSSTNSRYVS